MVRIENGGLQFSLISTGLVANQTTHVFKADILKRLNEAQ